MAHWLKGRCVSQLRALLRPVLGCDCVSTAQGLSLEEIEYAMGK